MAYEFNAPQFFDFASADQHGEGHVDDEQREDYFAFDHERGVPLEPAATGKENVLEENAPSAKDSGSSAGSAMSSVPCLPSVSAKGSPALRVAAADTPTRRSLRENVAKTVEAVVNSPKLELPKRANTAAPSTPKLAVSNAQEKALLSAQSGGGVVKRGSPAAARWKMALKKAVTPDILRQAREMRKKEQQGDLAAQQGGQSRARPPSPAAAVASARLAAATTAASRARTTGEVGPASSGQKPPPALANHPALKATHPKEFHLATSLRSQQRSTATTASGLKEPVKAGGVNHFSGMLAAYGQKMSARAQSAVARAAAVGRSSRRRSRSCGDRRGSAEVSGSRRRSPSPNPFSFVERDLAKVKERAAERIAQEKANNPVDFSKLLRAYPETASGQHDVHRTEPQPFSFTQREPIARRVRARSAEPPAPVRPAPIKAKPAPHVGVPQLLPKPMNARRTELEPFSFDKRDRDADQRRRERMEAILAEEKRKREFKAQPIPRENAHPALPARAPPPPTKPQPFNLAIDTRVEERLDKVSNGNCRMFYTEKLS